ncbi:hypothetical protein SAMN05216170_0249 [Thermococcus thioreducens]|uniref:Uncharacterized protein n=3 Tax=Thermococcus thioreducens TaxID=277988 RepID=A0A1I0M4R1_9EURY|nr:hypothetical protein SAMN05216170_0249 [Thermococcus thioreducens]
MVGGTNSLVPSTMEVPIPPEFKLIAKVRGVPEERLIRALQRFLVLEAISMNSRLDMKNARGLSKTVGKEAWKSL